MITDNLYNDMKAKAIILTSSVAPEKICAAAAKISTTIGSACEIYDKTETDKKAQNLVAKVLKSGHKSLIEHINFTIAFENVSVFVEQFMIEFRLASFTIKSRRYVDFRKMGYHVPMFRFSHNISQEKRNEVRRLYVEHMDYLFSQYEFLIEQGIPKEDARFILPYSYRSNFYCTVNARELSHILYSMIYGRGKEFSEINQLGKSLLSQVQQICPYIFENIEILEGEIENKNQKLNEILTDIEIKRKVSTESCELIRYTPNSDELVATTALINHTLCSMDDAEQLINSDKKVFDDIIEIVVNDKRKRELEHINFTFRINNISLAGLTHLVRHRMQSINIPVFTQMGICDKYIIPPTIASNNQLLRLYKDIWEKHRKIFSEIKELGVVDEDIVYMYLSGDVLDVVTTMNGRELFCFVQLRTCYRAQWEIREIGLKMLKKVKKIAPKTFENLGASCFVKGKCPEGKLTCGKFQEMQTFFKEV